MAPVPEIVSTPSSSSTQVRLSPHVPLSIAVQWMFALVKGVLFVPFEIAFHCTRVPPKVTSARLLQPSKAKFLSKSSRSTLNKSNVIIDITDADNTDEWIDFVEEYTSYFSDEEEHGVFLLLMHDTDISGISNIRCFDYDKYIHDFDVFMLCMTILSSQNCSIQKKQYISEIAVSLAKDNVVVA